MVIVRLVSNSNNYPYIMVVSRQLDDLFGCFLVLQLIIFLFFGLISVIKIRVMVVYF